jgi:hypothetical protein
MLLSEMVRHVKSEGPLYKDTTLYTSPTLHDWTTRKTTTLNIATPTLVYAKFRGYSSGSNAMGSLRLLHGTNPVLVYQTLPFSPGAERGLLMYLGSGSHSFALQTAVYNSPNNNEVVNISEFSFFNLDFPDLSGQEAANSVSVGSGQTATVLSLDLGPLYGRRTPAGMIKQYACIVTAYCEMVDKRGSYLVNPGESEMTSDVMNFKIYLDGVGLPWMERQTDYIAIYTNPSYSEGCFGRTFFAMDTNRTYTLEVKATNRFTTTQTARVVLNIVMCPWILIDSHQPLTLDFPQGSTLYLVMEPLTADVTKTVKLGWPRFISFGDSTDYYSTASGTGILPWNYTFESVEVKNVGLFVGGYGGCISVIAVDVR